MRGVKRLLALSLALLPALGQEYRALPGADTGRPDLDRSYALVYPAPRPKALLLLVPGLLGGSTNFALLAERLRAMAPGPEVWAWERRANGLEDRRGFLREDPVAYYRALALPDLTPLRAWGLEVHLKDLDLAVEAARARAPVVLAGHSLGAALAGLYALLHGEKLSGLVLLDGAPGVVPLAEEAFYEGADLPFGRLVGYRAFLRGRGARPWSFWASGPRRSPWPRRRPSSRRKGPRRTSPSGPTGPPGRPWPSSGWTTTTASSPSSA